MLHYLVVVHCGGPAEYRTPLIEQIDRVTSGWHSAISSPTIGAWVKSDRPSNFGFEHLQESPHAISICSDAVDQGAPRTDLSSRDRCGGHILIQENRESKTVTIYRDPTGGIECWRMNLEGAVILFSHLGDIFPMLPRHGLTLDWDYLQFHLANRWLHNEATGYAEIKELLPGDEITVSAAGIDIRRRWEPMEFVSRPFEGESCSRGALRDAAERSVRAWARRYRTISLDLSGGLDSAIVLGLLRGTAQHGDVVGLNFVIPHPEGDERTYAREAAELHGIPVYERSLADVFDAAEVSFRHRLLRPSIRTMPLGHDQIGSKFQAEMGSEAFFTGTGGDHVFYDHVRPNAAADFYRLNGLRGTLEQAHYLAQVCGATIWEGLSAVRKDAFARFSSPIEAIHEKCPGYFPENEFVRQEARSEVNLMEFLHPSVLEAALVATPSKLVQIMNIIELQKHYWRYGRADTSNEVHPLFSQSLIEASLRTPTYWFCSGGIQRGLARSAFADILPPSIANRRFKSSNTSHWIDVMIRKLGHFRELLLDGELASRKILDRDRAAEITKPLGLVRSPYFSNFLNTLSVQHWISNAI